MWLLGVARGAVGAVCAIDGENRRGLLRWLLLSWQRQRGRDPSLYLCITVDTMRRRRRTGLTAVAWHRNGCLNSFVAVLDDGRPFLSWCLLVLPR